MSTSSDGSTFNQVITADPTGFEAGWRRAAAAAKGGCEVIGGKVELMRNVVSAAFAAMNVGVALIVKNQLNLQDEFSKTAQKAGVSTEQISSMGYAAKLADVGFEQLTKAYVKLSGSLMDAKQGQAEAVELFRRLKLDPKNIRDADEMLLALAERFASMKDGAAKTALAVDIFGEKLGPGLVPFLNQGRSGIADLREEAARLGVVVSTESGKAAEEFNDTITRLNATMSGFQQNLAVAMVPTLQKVATGLNDVLKQALAVNKAGGFFASIAKELKAERVGDELKRVVDEIESIQATINRQGASGLLERRLTNLRAEARQLSGEAAEASDWLKRFANAANPPVDDAARGGDRGGSAGTPFVPLPKQPPKPKKEKKEPEEKSMMAYYQAQLEEEKLAAARMDASRDYSLQQELAYWQKLLATADLASKDRLEIGRKTAKIEVDILREAAKQGEQIQLERLRAKEAAALDGVAAAQMEAQASYAMEEITQLQLLELERQHEQQRAEIRRSALQAQQAMVDPMRDPVAFERLSLEIEAAERAHQLRMRQIQIQAAQEERDNPFNRSIKAVQQQMEHSLGAMLAGQMKFGAAMKSIWQSVRSAVAGELAKMLATKVAMFAKERLLTLFGIKLDAAKAGAGAAASVSSVPLIGPALAMAAMAALFGAVGGMSNNVPSAARGFDIPAGVNPLTQLHQREMVLPEKHADVIRGLAEGAAGSGAPIVLQGTPDDTVKLRDLARLLKSMRRDFVLTKGDLR